MKINNYKITGTFQYGKLQKSGLFLALSIIEAVCTIGIIVIMIIAPKEDLDLPTRLLLPLIGIVPMILAISQYISTIKIAKQIKVWMQDAVLAEGFMECTDNGLHEKNYRLTVKFGKANREIGTVTRYRYREVGYLAIKFYNKHLDRKISVLYSPSSNQVIFIEQTHRIDEIS